MSSGASAGCLGLVRFLAVACMFALPALPGWQGRASALQADGNTFANERTVQQAGVTLKTAVPDADEMQRIFGVPVLSKDIQPVWVEIANGGTEPLWYLPITTDPTYFSPLEVAFRFHDPLRAEANEALDRHFSESAMPLRIDPGTTAGGYVFTHREIGLKFLAFGFLQGDKRMDFHVVVPLSGAGYAVDRVDFDALVPAAKRVDMDLAGLRTVLAGLPCCTKNREGTESGDPLNVVLVGDWPDLMFPFVARGWHFTQAAGLRSDVDMAAAFVLRLSDGDAPVSPLYAFGRPQDLALQKARNTVSERNHLRLWLTPWRLGGRSVWVGQISRDIGVELTTTTWYGTTHKIDPMIDFDRDYLLQDLVEAGAVTSFGWLDGVGPSLASAPHRNLGGDPYVTDGRRLVMTVGPGPTFPGLPNRITWPAAKP